MSFKMNPQGIDKLFKQIAQKIEGVDRDIRREYSGRPAEEIEPVARKRFAAAGVNMATGDLAEYAKSVEEGKDFHIKLK